VDDLNASISANLGVIVVVLALVCVALVVATLLLVRRTARLDRRLRGLTRGAEGQSLEAILDAHLDKVYAVARDLDDVTSRTAVLEKAQQGAFQRIGLVRFNPFEDTGGNQSFALAVLDARGTGFVVSSLHARAGTRVYGKSVNGGVSESTLSAEETEAVRLALAAGARPAKAG
jgi:hypothetical protein